MKKTCLTLLLGLMPLTINAQAICPKTGNASELEQCLNKKLEQVVDELETNLQRIQLRFHGNDVIIAALRQSQNQWNQYRKQECGNVYQLWQNKPDQRLMTVSCSVHLARMRNIFLRQTYLPD